MKINPKITLDRVMDAAKRRMSTLANSGFCIDCGAEVEGVEPDASEYECECCGENKVYGAEELLLIMI